MEKVKVMLLGKSNKPRLLGLDYEHEHINLPQKLLKQFVLRALRNSRKKEEISVLRLSRSAVEYIFHGPTTLLSLGFALDRESWLAKLVSSSWISHIFVNFTLYVVIGQLCFEIGKKWECRRRYNKLRCDFSLVNLNESSGLLGR